MRVLVEPARIGALLATGSSPPGPLRAMLSDSTPEDSSAISSATGPAPIDSGDTDTARFSTYTLSFTGAGGVGPVAC